MNRDYLPFHAARTYQDRKMAKWMGFFISEHTESLHEMQNEVTISSMHTEELLLYLSQLYTTQTKFTCHLHKITYTGKIYQLFSTKCILKTTQNMQTINYNQIQKITILQEQNNE